MKLYAPKYYKNFKCIADRCPHSCCIGWEIDIDRTTLTKYESLSEGYGSVIKNSISYNGDPHFKLCEGDRCPHLNERGLCEIILNLGEDHICDICREHPRFYNFTDVAEVGIGMSCCEAARVILSSPLYYVYDEIGKMDANDDEFDFNGRCERAEIYEILRNTSESYTERLTKIYEKYDIFVSDDSIYLEIIETLEYLDEGHKALLLNYSTATRPTWVDEFLERALAYFIYRHTTEASDIYDFCDRLGFCLFCERLLASLITSQNAKNLDEIAALASIISEEIEYSDDNTASLML